MVPVGGHLAANNMSIAGTLAGLDLAITRMPHCRALDPIIKRNSLKRLLPGWSVDPIYVTYPSSIQPAKTRAFMDFILPMLGPAQACGEPACRRASASAYPATGPWPDGRRRAERQKPAWLAPGGFFRSGRGLGPASRVRA